MYIDTPKACVAVYKNGQCRNTKARALPGMVSLIIKYTNWPRGSKMCSAYPEASLPNLGWLLSNSDSE